MATASQTKIDNYAEHNGLEGLTKPSLISIIDNKKGYSIEKAKQFLQFQQKINNELLRHRIITNNEFTHWFETGDISQQQVKFFVVQFSVFSNLFLIAQLHKMINADTVDNMRASKEILANEIGVIFNAEGKNSLDVDGGGDPELVSIVGTVEGGKFRFKAAHFEWLLILSEKLGLTFEQVGKRHHGTKSTLFFCDELVRLYGSEDYLTSQAASYAVENWAAAGFWDELVTGFEKFNTRTNENLPMSFFSWHAKIEAQHALHTQEELEELYFQRTISEDKFIAVGNEILDGVAEFWDGLYRDR